VIFDKPTYAVQFVLSEPSIDRDRDRIEPEFRDLSIPLDVDVGRLNMVGTEEDEAVGSKSKNRRHELTLLN
jgi:hypothetical protein